MRNMHKYPATFDWGWLALAVLLVMPISAPARADSGASPWVEGFNNKVRILSGKASGGPAGSLPQMFAGIEIAMSPGFKTYWRNPGEAGGVPPEFDFSGSENLARATVFYPAPHRTKDKAGENIAYKDHVVFPVLITPKDAAGPVLVKLKVIYGVCKDICIPAEAELAIALPPDAAPSAVLTEILMTVPLEAADPSRPVGADFGRSGGVANAAKDPVLSAWRMDRKGGKPLLILEANDPGSEGGDAFAYSADGTYLPMSKKISEGNGKAVYELDLTDGADLKDLAGKTISITLTGSLGQSETFIQLPKDLATP